MYSIAIDGPAGAGKSTIAKAVARKIGFIYVDTGAMYRTMALYFLREGIDGHDMERVAAECPNIKVTLDYDSEGSQHIYLNGEDVSSLIRQEEVGKMASLTSAIPDVRAALLDLQRDLAKSNNVLMDGRDIGTHVLPNASLKIFLTASPDVRAKRRYDELKEKGVSCDYDQIREDIIKRDRQDSERAIAPLKQAEDAILLDSSDLTIPQVIDRVIECFENMKKRND
jgi:cytidylate kinase